jgi:hypothetical protein
MNLLSESAKIERAEIAKFAKENPDVSNSWLAIMFGKSDTTIRKILTEARNNEIPIFVVPSYCEENLFFVFDSISERKLHTDSENVVLNGYHFNQAEKEQIRKLGFKI